VLSIQNAAWIIGGTGTESAGTKWSCVRDNVTGLIWEVKTDSGSADSNTTGWYAPIIATTEIFSICAID
jgi:hypothetical protein